MSERIRRVLKPERVCTTCIDVVRLMVLNWPSLVGQHKDGALTIGCLILQREWRVLPSRKKLVEK